MMQLKTILFLPGVDTALKKEPKTLNNAQFILIRIIECHSWKSSQGNIK